MVEEEREKAVVEMEEMIEKGHGEVTFGSEGIRPREHIERKKGELEKGTWGLSNTSIEVLRRRGSGGECEEEKGLTAADLVMSRYLAEANRDQEEKRMRRTGKGMNLTEEKKEQTTVMKEMIVAAVEEEIDCGEIMTQEMVVAAAAELEDRWRRENEADEQAVLKQLLQGNVMGENCEEQKTEREQNER